MQTASISILKDLIACDTVSRKSNLQLLSIVADRMRSVGVAPTLISDETEKKANIYATIGPANKSGVMLSGHTDVVPVDGQDWTKPSFELTEEHGRLFGRGTADMKGFIACALNAAEKAARIDLKTPLHLAFSYDEEIGCVGVRSMIDMLEKAPVRPAMCIVGEPTNLTIATGHKGKTGLRARCVGKEGHSALAPFALNALHLGTDLVNILRDMQDEIASGPNRDDDYDVPYTTLHVGSMQGGVALNIVPNLCTIDFEIRNIAADDPAAILDDLRERLAPINEAARKVSPECGITFEIFNAYPGLDTPSHSAIVEFVKSLTGGNATNKVAYGTEGGLFSGVLGIPTVVCGPGSMEQGHKPDEFIEIDQMNRCDQMMDALIDRLVEGI